MIASRIAARAGLASIVVGLLSSVLLLIPASAASTSVSIVAMGTNGCSSTYCYQPASVTINGGDSVNWTDNTVVSHTVTRCGAAPGQNDSGCPAIGATGNNGSSSDQFNSPPLNANGGTYSHTFSGAGSYTYYCTIHGYSVMHGVVTVNAAATSATPAASPSSGPGGGTNPAASPAASPASLARTGGGPTARPRSGSLPIATALFVVLGLGALFVTAVVAARARTLR